MNETMWYLARAGGLTAYLLVTASVALGIVTSLKVVTPAWPRSAITEIHRYVTLVGLVFCGVHVGAILLDSEAGVGLVAALVPFASRWEPLGMALGVVGLELMVAIAFSTRIRDRIGYRTWRKLHYSAFAVFAMSLVHGLMTGTDTGSTLVALVYVLSVALILGLVVARVMESRAPSPRGSAPRIVRVARPPQSVGTPAPVVLPRSAATELPPLHPRIAPSSDGLPPLRPSA